ncbi:MAG TPA: hypothetical protein VNJ07_02660 [Chitinophagales bacterium]|nr:hypothetical protein [Chitinophagales bacterium]
MRFLYLRRSRISTCRQRLSDRFCCCTGEGTHTPRSCRARSDCASLRLSIRSLLVRCSLSVVGTSAGCTTRHSNPAAFSWRHSQKPEKPAS